MLAAKMSGGICFVCVEVVLLLRGWRRCFRRSFLAVVVGLVAGGGCRFYGAAEELALSILHFLHSLNWVPEETPFLRKQASWSPGL